MALMGPSGSGKSTLLNLIAGIDRPDSGTIEMGGTRTISRRVRARLLALGPRRLHIPVLQSHAGLTALENVELPLLLKDMPRKERRERAGMLLGLVGLAERLDHYPGELSGGEQQRVAISRAMVTDPTILVADEPTGDLDMESAEEVLRLMERLNMEFGKTIILVTHDPKAAGRARTVRRLEKITSMPARLAPSLETPSATGSAPCSQSSTPQIRYTILRAPPDGSGRLVRGGRGLGGQPAHNPERHLTLLFAPSLILREDTPGRRGREALLRQLVRRRIRGRAEVLRELRDAGGKPPQHSDRARPLPRGQGRVPERQERRDSRAKARRKVRLGYRRYHNAQRHGLLRRLGLYAQRHIQGAGRHR
ncbi:MAG: ABC transporter ATP-binding protein [Deltaproteobacteria bacterium]|nr:ABC transporter ATP-binding protein [Deltaproteobacteria bacterium]